MINIPRIGETYNNEWQIAFPLCGRLIHSGRMASRFSFNVLTFSRLSSHLSLLSVIPNTSNHGHISVDDFPRCSFRFSLAITSPPPPKADTKPTKLWRGGSYCAGYFASQRNCANLKWVLPWAILKRDSVNFHKNHSIDWINVRIVFINESQPVIVIVLDHGNKNCCNIRN